MRTSPRGWVAFGLGVGAVAWSLLLIAAAFYLPAYQGAECGSVGCTSTSASLFAVNGWWVVELLLLVALVVALTFFALHVRCATDSSTATKLAAAGIASLGVFSFVAGFSIGFGVFPALILLVASAVLTPSPGARPAR